MGLLHWLAASLPCGVLYTHVSWFASVRRAAPAPTRDPEPWPTDQLERALQRKSGADDEALDARDDGAPSLPPGLELIYVRHGQSTINEPLDEFNRLTKVACGRKNATSPEELAAVQLPARGEGEVCGARSRIAKNTNMRAEYVKETAGFPQMLADAAGRFLDAREKFDAPLTAAGVLQAVNLNEKTRELQDAWLEDHVGDPHVRGARHQTVLLSSNNIRAVDTMFNGLPGLARRPSVPIVLHTGLQEISQSGNGDTVSLFLPLGLSENSSTLASNGAWMDVALRRWQGYKDADRRAPGVIEATWAPRGDLADMGWWQRRHLHLVQCDSTDNFAQSLVNHCYFLPNKYILEHPDYREPPPGPLKTVRLPNEYESALGGAGAAATDPQHAQGAAAVGLGQERVKHFLAWLHKLHRYHTKLKRVVISAHSTWFLKFMQYMQRRGGLADLSCAAFASSKLRNTAVVRVADGACSCLFDGDGLGGTCIDDH